MLTVAPRIRANNVHYRTVRQSIVIFLLALIGCARPHQPQSPSPSQDEADVLTVVVEDRASRTGPGLLLFPASSSRFIERIPDDSFPTAEREARADLIRRNADTAWAGVPLKLRSPYRWVTTKNFTEFKENVRDWSGMTLSHVGFSVDRREAIVDVGIICGTLCGAGSLVFLHRGPDNLWHITRRYATWVA